MEERAMKTNFRFLALSAAILSMFTACQREELEQNQKPEALTHSVTFVAGAPETKTTVDISDGKTAKFKWTKADEGRFTVYENGVTATKVFAELDTEGKMSMTATFSGDVPASPKYQALYNSEVSANQNIVKDSYAEVSDVMVSNVLDGTRDDNFVFSFKREVAFAKMTLKGLTSGAYVSSVTIKSDKPIAGEYDLETGTFVNTSNVITLDVFHNVVDGNATVWFTTIPVEEAIFTITAKTTDDAVTVAGTYTRKFTKSITLTRGNVKGFGVAMAELVDPHKNDNGWFLVKDARFLAAGDVIRIGCASKSAVAGSMSDDYLTKADATYDVKTESMVSAVSPMDFTLGGTEGAWTLTNSGVTLGSTAVKKLALGSDLDDYVETWSITITNTGKASITSTSSTYGAIYYNSSNPRFLNYANSFNGSIVPEIYKKYGTPAEAKKNQTISFNPTSYTATIGNENTYPTLTAQSTGAKTWTSSNTKVATINESTGDITLVAAGSTTISVTVAGDDTYNEGTGSYELTVKNATVGSGDAWILVTDASTLAAGDVIVIVAATSNFAMSTTQNTNNRGQQAITKNANDNTVSINDKVQQLTLGAGTTKGTFSLSTGDGYLYAASSSDNYLKTKTTLDDNGSWTITIEKNVATLKANGTNTRNLLKYNSSNKPPIFSCYSSGQGAVQIYKLSGSSEGGSTGGSTGGGEPGTTKYYKKVSSITSGKSYLIVGGGTSPAKIMKHPTKTAATVGFVQAQVSNNQIASSTDIDACVVTITKTGEYYTIAFDSNYISAGGSNTDLKITTTPPSSSLTDNANWVISTVTSYGSFQIKNSKQDKRAILWRSGTNKFGDYSISNANGKEYYNIDLYELAN